PPTPRRINPNFGRLWGAAIACPRLNSGRLTCLTARLRYVYRVSRGVKVLPNVQSSFIGVIKKDSGSSGDMSALTATAEQPREQNGQSPCTGALSNLQTPPLVPSNS
ncbi:hypothetical protein PN498_02065, partial [Oscillatoria sp. CS-180]|uniref:hypothetical protein n=1 Tax=Oscillatoria sp. CS-180 TaxID=3021720 RepID=UPI0023305929